MAKKSKLTDTQIQELLDAREQDILKDGWHVIKSLNNKEEVKMISTKWLEHFPFGIRFSNLIATMGSPFQLFALDINRLEKLKMKLLKRDFLKLTENLDMKLLKKSFLMVTEELHRTKAGDAPDLSKLRV